MDSQPELHSQPGDVNDATLAYSPSQPQEWQEEAFWREKVSFGGTPQAKRGSLHPKPPWPATVQTSSADSIPFLFLHALYHSLFSPKSNKMSRGATPSALYPHPRFFREEDPEAMRKFETACAEAFGEFQDRNGRLSQEKWQEISQAAETLWYSRLFERERPVEQPLASFDNLAERVPWSIF